MHSRETDIKLIRRKQWHHKKPDQENNQLRNTLRDISQVRWSSTHFSKRGSISEFI